MANPIVTDTALTQIEKIMQKERVNSKLRISILGGGCSGFQYKYDIVDEQNEDDLILGRSTAHVLIDPISLPFLADATIDYVSDIAGASFKITNPNTAAECGCGVSFSM
ncbi:MAG: iron-sulfur cluster assembly accessory protein [Rhizobiales bacterium]|nr:iron-sulfur cluster assembly accessory protein [Hyphomicrobiales bacterium]NRB14989.1 iron-sulfur cluster assembly accessory protein [Hyphomicrobiales bacterium]